MPQKRSSQSRYSPAIKFLFPATYLVVPAKHFSPLSTAGATIENLLKYQQAVAHTGNLRPTASTTRSAGPSRKPVPFQAP